MNNIPNCSNPVPGSVSVQTVDGLKSLANCYAYVSSINSTFFVDSCRHITIIYSGPVYINNYDPTQNPLDLRDKVCYDFANNVAYIFNPAGDYRTITLEGGN